MPNIPSWSDIRKRATPSFMFIAPLVGLILLAAYLRFTISPEPVILQIDVPRTISVAEDAASVDLNITLRLVNNTDEEAALSVAGECRVLRWYIVDAAEQIIQSALPRDCSDDAVYEVIEADSAFVHSTGFTLDPSRYIPGDPYELRIRFWGYEASNTFRITD